MRFSRLLYPFAFALPALALIGYGAARLSARPDGYTQAIVGPQKDGSYLVPTGQTIRPAGQNLTFVGRPEELALSPDGKTMAVLVADGIKLFDTATQKFAGDPLPGAHNFGGIAWSPDGKTLYATGQIRDADEGIRTGAVTLIPVGGGVQAAAKPILFSLQSRILPNKSATDSHPTGIAVSPDGKTLYVTLFNNGTVAAVDLGSYDPASGAAKTVEIPVGSSPEHIVVSPDGGTIYVANRGGKTPESGDTEDEQDPVVVDPKTYKASTGTVSVIDARTQSVTGTIPVGLQPAALAFAPDGKHLFVANANADSVSVVDTTTKTVSETIPTSPAPGRLAASSPNGLAVAPDGKTLYVTLGGDNALEVLNLDTLAGGSQTATKIAGLIPTAWFPLGVTLGDGGKTLYVANSKGIGSLGPLATYGRRRGGATMPQAGPGGALSLNDYPAHSVYAVVGSLSVLPVPNASDLTRDTEQAGLNTHFDRMAAALTQKPDAYWSRFKHVVLVIKENRTFDQVFGDMPIPTSGHIGADSHLTMFGEQVTPNHHALARRFGLFDNLYCSGAISADGHHWLNEAFADDYDERAMNNYPRAYPCCGLDPLSFAGNPFLWQAAMAQGLTFRNYGEFDPLPSIRPHSDATFNDQYVVTADLNEDVSHVNHVLSDLDAHGLAQLSFMWFGNDHTSGTSPGRWTPESDVADNDRAVGMLVDTISHSRKYWHDEPTAIFVVEDDAQGGLDHIDGHRTVGLVISPFNKKGEIISTNYNQLDMLRTMELMLGMKPLNQFDAAALPLRNVFTDTGDFTPYTSEKNRIALNLKNPPLSKLSAEARHWAKLSAQMNFSKPDLADPEQLTQVLWHHARGSQQYPPTDAARG